MFLAGTLILSRPSSHGSVKGTTTIEPKSGSGGRPSIYLRNYYENLVHKGDAVISRSKRWVLAWSCLEFYLIRGVLGRGQLTLASEEAPHPILFSRGAGSWARLQCIWCLLLQKKRTTR